MLAALAVVLAVVGVSRTASAADPPDVTVEMGMVDPGGDFSSIVHEQQWGDLGCGAVIHFLTRVSVVTTDGSFDPGTISLDLAFDAATSGQPGAGYTSFVGDAQVIADPAGTQAPGSGVTASLVNTQLTNPYQPGGQLTATLEVEGLGANQSVVVAIDVRVTCLAGANRAGILYAVASGLRNDQGELGVGQLRQQLIQVNPDSGDETGLAMTVAKDPNPATISSDDAPVDFTVTVDNNWTGTALPVDSLSDDVFGDITTVHGDITATDCALSTIDPGGTYECSFTATVHATADEDHVDTVTVAVGEISARATATVTRETTSDQPGVPVPVLGLTASVDPPGPAHGGDTLTVSVTVSNDGSQPLTDVHVFEATLGLDQTLSSLGIGESQTFTSMYVVSDQDVDAQQVTFDPAATSTETPTPVTEHLVVPVVAPVLTLSNQPSQDQAEVGDVVTFTLTVINDGTEVLTNVRVVDDLLGIDTVFPTLGVAESQQLSGDYTVTTDDADAGQVVNPAQATSDQTDEVEATAIVGVGAFVPSVLDLRAGDGTLPRTGNRTEGALWLAAALATAGAAYVTAGRKPRRSVNRI